jgi:hypothetical protein
MEKKSNIYSCKECHYNTSKIQSYNKHLLTKKHKNNTLEINGDIKNGKNSNNINAMHSCDICNFQCKHKSNYKKHLLTEKHKNKSNGEPTEKKYTCSQCNKEYLNYKSLWKHKKKCIVSKNKIKTEEIDNLQNTFTPQLFMELFNRRKELEDVLVKQNRELQNKLLEKENQLLAQKEEHHKQIIELIIRQISNININT